MKCVLILAALVVWSGCAAAQDIRIIYAEQKVEHPPVLSGLKPIPQDLGAQGAARGIVENTTTGKLVGQHYQLDSVIAGSGEDLVEKLRPVLKGQDIVVVNAPAATVLAVADMPEARSALFLNAGAVDEVLREEACRKNILHIAPTTSMLTDALAQFLVKKKWLNWSLVSGVRPNDKAYAESIKQSAVKFGANVVSSNVFSEDTDLRESAADEVPLLTQDSAQDVVVVADANDDFGSLIAYNTFYARPIVGTHGLVPTSWHEMIETWGAVQLQNAFRRQAGRGMRDIDFNAYLAVRLVGEAATRTQTADATSLRKFLLSPEFLMQAYKGRGVSFRAWNGQLRQPIHLVTKETQVAAAPMEGFLHERNELDTLGPDEQETKCKNFNP